MSLEMKGHNQEAGDPYYSKEMIRNDAPINTGKVIEITGLEKRIFLKHFVSEILYKFQMRV